MLRLKLAKSLKQRNSECRKFPQRIEIERLRIVPQVDRRFGKEVWVRICGKQKFEVVEKMSFQFSHSALQKRRKEGRSLQNGWCRKTITKGPLRTRKGEKVEA